MFVLNYKPCHIPTTQSHASNIRYRREVTQDPRTSSYVILLWAPSTPRFVVVVGSDQKLLHSVSNLDELQDLSIYVANFERICNISRRSKWWLSSPKIIMHALPIFVNYWTYNISISKEYNPNSLWHTTFCVCFELQTLPYSTQIRHVVYCGHLQLHLWLSERLGNCLIQLAMTDNEDRLLQVLYSKFECKIH